MKLAIPAVQYQEYRKQTHQKSSKQNKFIIRKSLSKKELLRSTSRATRNNFLEAHCPKLVADFFTSDQYKLTNSETKGKRIKTYKFLDLLIDLRRQSVVDAQFAMILQKNIKCVRKFVERLKEAVKARKELSQCLSPSVAADESGIQDSFRGRRLQEIRDSPTNKSKMKLMTTFYKDNNILTPRSRISGTVNLNSPLKNTGHSPSDNPFFTDVRLWNRRSQMVKPEINFNQEKFPVGFQDNNMSELQVRGGPLKTPTKEKKPEMTGLTLSIPEKEKESAVLKDEPDLTSRKISFKVEGHSSGLKQKKNQSNTNQNNISPSNAPLTTSNQRFKRKENPLGFTIHVCSLLLIL